MKRSRFSEEQIIGILREQETGITVSELCRKHGVSSPTFYKWKAKYGGMDVSEARKLSPTYGVISKTVPRLLAPPELVVP